MTCFLVLKQVKKKQAHVNELYRIGCKNTKTADRYNSAGITLIGDFQDAFKTILRCHYRPLKHI